MRFLQNENCRVMLFTILLIGFCLIPFSWASESRGIKVVAVDKATKEWKEYRYTTKHMP